MCIPPTVLAGIATLPYTPAANIVNCTDSVPDLPGIYVLRAMRSHSGSVSWAAGDIIYVGQASKSLKKRFRNQEILAKGHGTFFRTLGVVLGKNPKPHCLYRKKSRNFTFSSTDKVAIRSWISQNAEYLALDIRTTPWLSLASLSCAELDLIKHYAPPLNIKGNASKFRPLLLSLRDQAVRLARLP